MKFKTAADFIAVAKDRGYTVHVNPGPPPMPYLKDAGGKDKPQCTDALLGALKAWRLEIIDELTKGTP